MECTSRCNDNIAGGVHIVDALRMHRSADCDRPPGSTEIYCPWKITCYIIACSIGDVVCCTAWQCFGKSGSAAIRVRRYFQAALITGLCKIIGDVVLNINAVNLFEFENRLPPSGIFSIMLKVFSNRAAGENYSLPFPWSWCSRQYQD